MVRKAAIDYGLILCLASKPYSEKVGATPDSVKATLQALTHLWSESARLSVSEIDFIDSLLVFLDRQTADDLYLVCCSRWKACDLLWLSEPWAA
jgi:hypothetical protein